MSDRRKLQEELNKLNEMYQAQDLKMRKIGATDVDRQRLRDMMVAKKEKIINELGDDMQKLQVGTPVKLKQATITGVSDLGSQDKLPDAAKQVGAGKFSKLSKKLAGVIPLAGVGMAALSGDPAMAAEELAEDVPVAGQVYSAIKPTESGNREEEKIMLAEDRARRNYANSPAAMDRKGREEGDRDTDELLRMRKNALMGIK